MQSVFDADGLNHSEKVVLLAYCNYTDAHGYVWAGVPRVSDDTGASESTIKRVRKELHARGLLATRRRVDPRTGRSTSNITRINLELLDSMKRAPRKYDDNVIEELLFEDGTPKDSTPSDLRTVQSDTGPDLRTVQSDPTSEVKMTSPEGQVNLTPNPSDEPSGSSSSGGSTDSPTPQDPGEEEDDDTPTAKKTPQVPDAAETVMARTDATAEEAEAVVDAIETEADDRHTRLGTPKVGQIDAYVARFGGRDLRRHLKWVRAQHASQARTDAPEATGPDQFCGEHHEPLPCEACAGLPLGMIRPLLRRYGPVRRPDLDARVNPNPAPARV